MKILAIDIGVGTQDIMLYNTDNPIENSVKLVLPAPTNIFANRIKKCRSDIFINGATMGGGPVNKAIKNHLARGYKVVMTENSARTIRDDIERVKALGIQIIPNNEKSPELPNIEFKDIDLNAIENALLQFDVALDFDYIGVAVQDHGYMEGMGDRNFRFMKIKEKLNIPRNPEEFAYHREVPKYFTRMNGVKNTLEGVNVTIMDSKFASICGATCDNYMKKINSYIIMDIGNGHTLAASFENNKIFGVFEHHTSSLNPEKIVKLLFKLKNGTITNDEVYQDGGHGACVTSPMSSFECVVATGPRRRILEKTDLKVHYAAPAGDVMMTGPVGLIKTILAKHTF
jgi:uncharacterized protein (DUF1786 family)